MSDLPCPLPEGFRTGFIKPRTGRRNSIIGQENTCLNSRNNNLCYTFNTDRSITREKAVIFQRKIKELKLVQSAQLKCQYWRLEVAFGEGAVS